MSLLTWVTSPFLAHCPEMLSQLGLLRLRHLADAGVRSAGLWLSMLVCVSILCTCFIAYISRMDWRKAAEEVTRAPTASCAASGKVLSALAGICSGIRQHHGLNPSGQRCPGLSSSAPSKTQWSHDCSHVPVFSSLPHICTQ